MFKIKLYVLLGIFPLATLLATVPIIKLMQKYLSKVKLHNPLYCFKFTFDPFGTNCTVQHFCIKCYKWYFVCLCRSASKEC